MNKSIPVIVGVIGIIVTIIGISVGFPSTNNEQNNTVTQSPEINININTDPDNPTIQVDNSNVVETDKDGKEDSIKKSIPDTPVSINCSGDSRVVNSNSNTKAIFYGPCEYKSFNDSPFYDLSSNSGDNFKLEDFELSGELTKSGVTLKTQVEMGNIVRSYPVNSVEFAGDSLLFQTSQIAEFQFDELQFGNYPNYAWHCYHWYLFSWQLPKCKL